MLAKILAININIKVRSIQLDKQKIEIVNEYAYLEHFIRIASNKSDEIQ